MEQEQNLLGKHNGFIYGRIFRSGLRGGNLVIDAGIQEFRIFDNAAVWDGERFATKDVINCKYNEIAS